MDVPPDKVRVAAYYDERDGSCHSIDVVLNYDGISRDDLAQVIRAVFRPELPSKVTQRDAELGSTGVLQMGRTIHDAATTVTNVNSLRQARG